MYSSFKHLSVLPAEVLKAFDGLNCSIFVDGTLGAGGHSELVLKNHPEIVKLIAIDQDPTALEIARQNLLAWQAKISFVHANFRELATILHSSAADAILLDLGVSSMQLDNAARGFSFQREGPLDMRMNPNQPLTAGQIVNSWSEAELGRIFREYGEEKRWKLAAQIIVRARAQKAIETTKELVDILQPYFRSHYRQKIHPLT